MGEGKKGREAHGGRGGGNGEGRWRVEGKGRTGKEKVILTLAISHRTLNRTAASNDQCQACVAL